MTQTWFDLLVGICLVSMFGIILASVLDLKHKFGGFEQYCKTNDTNMTLLNRRIDVVNEHVHLTDKSVTLVEKQVIQLQARE